MTTANGVRSFRASHASLALLALSLSAVPALAGGDAEAAATPPSEPVAGAPVVRVGSVEMRRVEVRANTFTSSSQDAVTLDQDAAGNTVVVWHSRRQEKGTYGIFAQRFDAGGRRQGAELHVNSFTEGMQTAPTVALGDDGGAWFAWYSRGQDGSQGSIVARRVAADGTDGGEVLVNARVEGDQRSVTCAALPGGGAVFVWTTPDGDEGAAIAARVFAADGTPGAEIRVDATEGDVDDLPAVDVDAGGRATVAWARRAPGGAPSAIVMRRLDVDGTPLGDEIVVSDAGGPVEPVLAVDAAGACAVAWLAAGESDYELRLRRFDAEGRARGPAVHVPTETPGYLSGVALDLRDTGELALAWNGIARGDANVWLRLLDADDAALGETVRATAHAEGDQRIQQASSRRHLLWAEDGRLALAWTGDAGLEDASGAHLTVLVPADSDLRLASDRAPAALFAEDELELTAKPHEPPIFVPQIPRMDVTGITAPESAPGPGFVGVTQTGLTPPDPDLAVGPDHVVQVVNDVIAFFTKGGTNTFTQSLDGAGGFFGPVGANAGSFVFDPEVIWDPHSQRFMAMANERNGSSSFFLLAVSDDTDPNGTWFKYRFNVTPQAGANIDSPNIGVDDQAIYLSADFFGPDRFLIFIVEKAPTLVGGVPITRDLLVTGSQSYGSPVVYDSGMPAYYYVEAFFTNPGTSLRLHAITDPLGSPQRTTVTVNVPAYLAPEDPPQQGTTVRPETFEARFWSAVVRNGSLWATHHVDLLRVRQRWYQIDLGNWPTSGTPTLVQSGEADAGDPVRTFFGSIHVDSLDNMSLVMARSSPTEFISMACASRLAGDPLGFTGPVQIVQSSTAPDFNGRWGDYSGILSDPYAEGRFWGTSEFTMGGGWLTWIGNWDVAEVPTSYCTGKTTSGACLPFVSFAGQPSATSPGAFLVQHNESVPNESGLLLYGFTKSNLDFHGGKLCIKSPVKRTAAKASINLNDGGCSNWALRRNFNKTIQNGFDPQLTAGATVFSQWLQRDPTNPLGFGDNLSDGLRFVINP